MLNLLIQKKKGFLYPIVFLLLILLNIGCGNNENNNSNTKTSRFDDVEKVRLMIENTKMASLQKVLGDTIALEGQESIILVYTGYDCGSCIEQGFDIVKRVEKMADDTQVYVVASNTSILNDQHRYDYKKFIYRDSKDLVRKQLKFYYSPTILFMKEDLKPKHVFFPGLDEMKDFKVEE